MKKAILILCVLAVLALLAVPILAEGLSAGGEPDRQLAPKTGGYRGAEKELDRQMAPKTGGFRGAEAPNPAQLAIRGTWCSPAPAA